MVWVSQVRIKPTKASLLVFRSVENTPGWSKDRLSTKQGKTTEVQHDESRQPLDVHGRTGFIPLSVTFLIEIL